MDEIIDFLILVGSERADNSDSGFKAVEEFAQN